ncbi:MAG TPA: hypothetical protein VEQ58_10510, partial [Polyangiaceae bacterium]|nr:hypothetical protein [Polyangiaceae bacterium]
SGKGRTWTPHGRRSSLCEFASVGSGVTRPRAYALLAVVCVLPRLGVLLHERGDIISAFAEKSWRFANTFVESGTFGFIAGTPSANTQPLYAFFLIPIVWVFDQSWLAVGLAQIAVAVATSLLVYEIGRRVLSRRAGLLAALGATLRHGGAADQAAAWFGVALKLNPQSAYVETALGAIHSDAGRFEEAIPHFRRALEIDKSFHPARGYLDTALEETGRFAELEAVYRDAIAVRPEDPIPHNVLLFNMQYWPNVSARDILAEARVWNERHARPLAAQALPLHNERSPERRLRIGYVSPDFREHAMSRFTIPVLRNHDHASFEIYCYSSATKPSAETAIIRGCADVWRETATLDDAALAELIRSDQIDIVVDLTMHLLGCRLLAFARRPAPIQMCWLAYPGTTGLETMDYRLSDPFLDPEGIDTSVYSEETLRLPDSYWCYDQPSTVPEVSPLPALTAGRITFGSLNHFRKVNDGVFRLWASVLNAVPSSRLLLVAPEGGARDRVRAFFEAAGVNPERIEFVGRCSRLDYLARYREIDIGLETLPYNGQTTSLDALWMGVPTVTLVGETVVGRAGVCQAMNLGLPELIATTPEQYVQSVVALASDLERLSELRQTLRARLQQSPLMDAPRFARNLESAYRDAWRRYCAKHE